MKKEQGTIKGENGNGKNGSRKRTNQGKTLDVAAGLFLEQGYTQTNLRLLAQKAETSLNFVTRIFGCKENILCELVTYVLEEQFSTAAKKLEGIITNDPILFYAAETTMQLYMAESRESVRELYLTAYSMPRTMDIIQQMITVRLEQLIKAHLPTLTTKNFYELEIASGGIMRSFMARPCDMYFTMDRKVTRFLETTFHVFRVPDEKIQEAVQFVQQFDFQHTANGIIDRMLEYLKEKNGIVTYLREARELPLFIGYVISYKAHPSSP